MQENIKESSKVFTAKKRSFEGVLDEMHNPKYSFQGIFCILSASEYCY